MVGNGAENNPIWRTMMAKPEVSIKGMKKTTHMEQSQTELIVPVLVQVGCKAKYRENRRRVTPSTHIFNFSIIHI